MWFLAPWRLPDLLSRPWRLVRELDHIEDARCRRLLEVVRNTRGVALLACAGVAIVVAPLCNAALTFFIDGMGRTDQIENAWERAALVVGRIVLIGTTLTVAFIPYAVLVRRAMLRHLERARCPRCAYGLIGLRFDGGRTICPECGERIVLEALGLTEADVLAEERDAAAPASAVTARSGLERAGRWCLAAAGGAMLLGAVVWVVTDKGGMLAAGVFVMMWVGVPGVLMLAMSSTGSRGTRA